MYVIRILRIFLTFEEHIHLIQSFDNFETVISQMGYPVLLPG